jgi:hypothetical protein
MKRIIFIIIIFFVALTLVESLTSKSAYSLYLVDQTGNLIANGNFENGTTNWVTSSYYGAPSAFDDFRQWSGSGSVSTQLVTDPLAEGNYTGHVVGSSPDNELFVDGIYQYEVRSAETYTVSAWVHANTGSAYLGLAWDAGLSYTPFDSCPKTATTGQWEYLQIKADVNNTLGGPYLYAASMNSDFYVEGMWLNQGNTTTSPFAPSTGFDPNIEIYSVSTGSQYITDTLLLGDTFSFDYWWEMGVEPTEFNLDVLFFNGVNWETFGWVLNFDGDSDQWESASFWVPPWARGENTQVMFSLLDWGQETDPTVYLRNIGTSVPEPSTLLLIGFGILGIGFIRKGI